MSASSQPHDVPPKEQHSHRSLRPRARLAAISTLGIMGSIGVIHGLHTTPRLLERSSASRHTLALQKEDATGQDQDTGKASPVSLHVPPEERTSASATADMSHRGSIRLRINLNTATAAELDLLPRIGPALAGRIIEDRQRNGPYRSIDDLDRVPGIGPKTIAKLVPFVTVDE